MKIIYIASPYSKGNKKKNVMTQTRAFHILMEKGYCPIAPLITGSHVEKHFKNILYEDWISIDFVLISKSDALLRLPGESNGADREVEFALSMGIPVHYSIDDFLID